MSHHDQYRKDFIRELTAMAARHNIITVFGDSVGMMAASLALATARDKAAAEREYQTLADRYTKEELAHLPKMLVSVIDALELRRESFLGPILEEIGAANQHNGQFLTPNDVATLMAKFNMDRYEHTPGKVVSINDPACGAGVTLIAQAEALVQERHVPQRDVFIIGGDIDKRACDMTFVELTLLGYAARVDHMNALTMEVLSPARYTIGYYLHGIQWRTAA